MVVFVLAPWLVLVTSHSVFADVSPGDVIDKSTWSKAEGLLPEPILDWVKKGDFVLHVGELNFDQSEFFASAVKESMTKNAGKYSVDEEDQIVDATTGKRPEFIAGFPFPAMDPNDPKAAIKAMYNKHYHTFSFGNIDYPFQMVWIGRNTGFEREISCVYVNAPLEGCPAYQKAKNPEEIERYTVLSVRSPFDVKGTSVMLWRYKSAKKDTNFAYVPAIRRVRRTSPANRSDSFVGSDCCVDDAWGYDGKINAFDWKLIGAREALVPYKKPDPEVLVQGRRPGEWKTAVGTKPSKYGHETEGWQGAPWAPTNFIWVKRPVWVIQSTPKDRYYNYGSVQFWYDPELYFPKYGLIFDRAGDYWKTFLVGHQAFQSQDGKMKLMIISIQQMIDDRTQHSSYVENYSDRNLWTNYTRMDLNDFSLAGFMKFCK
jgi:hypothetical protein